MILRSLAMPFVLLLISLSLSKGMGAQTATSGGLTGVVTDPSGALVPDANVELKDNAKGIIHTGNTNSEGRYLFFFVAPGNYTLTVAHSGFRTVSQILDVSVGPPVTVNIRLVIAGTYTALTVSEEAPLIHAEDGDASSTMSRLQVEQVPNPG